MTVLSAESLIHILNVSRDKLDCGGLKLHVDKIFAFSNKGGLYNNVKKISDVVEVKPDSRGIYELAAGAYRIRYKELVKVPDDALALAIPRSTLLRIGATIFTAVWDPGYEGRGEGLMVVFNPHGIELEEGVQVAQLVFVKLDRATRFVYRGSYYRENIT